MASTFRYIRAFDSLALDDLPLVGGKTASLGELRRLLAGGAVQTPDGFAVTADAYRQAVSSSPRVDELQSLFRGLDVADVTALAQSAARAREIIYEATAQTAITEEIQQAYRLLEQRYGKGLSVAVRSSATAEDLPDASFAGQHDSFLHVRGEKAVVEACRRCFASLFTDRAVVYRENLGFDHFKVALSVAVMQMVNADDQVSGVIFTLDPDSGFRDVVLVSASYGLGEGVVQGHVDPDEFYVHKPTYRDGARAVVSRRLGAKQLRYGWKLGRGGASVRTAPTSMSERQHYCVADEDVLALAGASIRIESHYSERAGRATPMDIEWARDAEGRLHIVQARPETVASRRQADEMETFHLAHKGVALICGRAVGERIASGPVRVIRSPADLAEFKGGEVLVAAATSPDWEPVMRSAAAVVTDRGGRTCHAAIVARELGLPAVVGAGDATSLLANGRMVTVCCAEGAEGRVYDGQIPYEVERLSFDSLPRTETPVMLNIAQPDFALRAAQLPSQGVGLARLEFIISQQIGIHPMAVAHPERVALGKRGAILRRARADASVHDFFVRSLSEGVGLIAAAFHPRPVIARLSDFKTNEYAQLLGGRDFEPKEENPMIGFRGAARYAHPLYADGFALECEALARVRRDMGLRNLKVMVPFCRRVDEARAVLDAMAAHGLARATDGLEVYMMCEIPNNVVQIDAFASLFDGLSIGSNDLTQLALGVDRDSEIVAFDFDERDPGVLEMLRQAVEGAHRVSRPIGVCGEAPATYPEVADFLTRLGVDSLSVNPQSLGRTLATVAAAEAARASGALPQRRRPEGGVAAPW